MRARRTRPPVAAHRGRPTRLALAVLALALLIAGCSATERPELPSAPPPTASASVPGDGISLRSLGFVNGPARAFSLPRTAVVGTRVDQSDGVTVVLSRPAATDVAAYLRRALPESGFVVTADSRTGAALTFTGYGWQGSFTGTGDASAVILKP